MMREQIEAQKKVSEKQKQDQLLKSEKTVSQKLEQENIERERKLQELKDRRSKN